MSDSYEERREQRREEERQYQADVAYQVWRNGGDMDRVDRERVNEHYWQGDDCDRAASHELRSQRPKPPQEEEPEYPEQSEQ